MTIHLPMEELKPALSQVLTSKPLLKHRSPSIRLKTLHAIRALYFPSEVGGKRGGSFPLELGRIVGLLEKEVDTGVVCVLSDILRLIVIVSFLISSIRHGIAKWVRSRASFSEMA